MKITETLHIHMTKYPWDSTPAYTVINGKLDDTDYRTYICSQEVELEIPDDYDPRAQKIAALREQQTKAAADYQKTVTEIQRRISELQAIEYTE